MRKALFLAMLFLFSLVRPGLPAEVVNFKSTAGYSLTLEGKLTKPSGEGPFPALVLLHGCGGISRQRDDVWAKRLADWGYAALQVDSFGPRRESNICASRALLNDFVPLRVGDAYAAKSFLAGLPEVDPERIAIMGWSHGGWSTLEAIGPRAPARTHRPESPFRAAIAFYPYCGQRLDRLESPLLILIGGSDDWTPAMLCEKNMPPGKTHHEVVLKVYPGAYHGFDTEGGLNRQVRGSSGVHQMKSDPSATEDAVGQVKRFLEKYLKP